jgi:hypothetical protein
MPRGVPKNTEGISKMEGVRRALSELGTEAANKDIQTFLKSQFGIDMDSAMISSYKSNLKAAGKIPAAPQPSAQPPDAAGSDGITLDDIRAVKEVIDKVGAEKVRQLTEVLAK